MRYARSWKAGADVVSHETEFERDGVMVPATLVLPSRRRGAVPGWVAVGGISRMGRFHPQLVRFTEALASSGAAVLVPEIPEWRRLEVVPRPAAPTIRGCVDVLRKRSEVRPGKFGLIGFSFGAAQVAMAAASEDLADQVAGIVLFGGYCSLERTVTCQLTGRHEWKGVDYELTPDPYGKWVIASNYLTDVPGFEDASDVTAALRRLAAAASEQRVPAWDPYHDAMISELRRCLPLMRQPLFDLFATPTGVEAPEVGERLAIARQIAVACRRVEPLLEPASLFAGVGVPTRLIHGRGDRLIPFTESMRLNASLPPASRRGHTVTGLFSHTADRATGSRLSSAWEGAALFAALRGLINTV